MVLSCQNLSKISSKPSSRTSSQGICELDHLKCQLESLTRTLNKLRGERESRCCTQENPSIEIPCDTSPCESKTKISRCSPPPVRKNKSVLKYFKQLQKIDKILVKREKKFQKKCELLNKKIEKFEKERINKEKRNAELEAKIQLAKLKIEKGLYKDMSGDSIGSCCLFKQSSSSGMHAGCKCKQKKKMSKDLKKMMAKKAKACRCQQEKSLCNSLFQTMFGRCQCQVEKQSWDPNNMMDFPFGCNTMKQLLLGKPYSPCNCMMMALNQPAQVDFDLFHRKMF